MTDRFYIAPAGTEHPISMEDLKKWADITVAARPYFRSNVLGNWEYTPAEELRDRLNTRLQGKQPKPAINTRFWRGL